MKQPVVYYVASVLFVIITLIVIKTILFFKASRKRTFGRWFYFNKRDIVNSTLPNIQALKRRQNNLSIAMLVVILASAVIFLVFESFFE